MNALSGTRFLIDTRAEISVLPANTATRCKPTTHPLTATNGTWGRKTISFHLGHRHFTWTFTVSTVEGAIQGSDFLRSSGLLVDVKNNRLLDAENLAAMPLKRTNKVSLRLESFSLATDSYGHLLAKFPSITTPMFTAATVKHGIRHVIRTKGLLLHARARRLETQCKALVKTAFKEPTDLRIAYRSQSCCASALVAVDKPNGSIRCCRDYGPLNAITVPDKYPVPHI